MERNREIENSHKKCKTCFSSPSLRLDISWRCCSPVLTVLRVSACLTVRDVDEENTQLKPARLRGHRVTGAMFYWRIFPFSEVSIIFHYETFLNNLNSFLCRWEDIETDLKRVQSESWSYLTWYDWISFLLPCRRRRGHFHAEKSEM